MPEVECDYCGDLVYKKPSIIKKRKNIFCDQSCYGDFLSKENTGEEHHQYDRITVSCANCGDEKEVHPSHHKKVENHYCDAKCQAENEDRSGANNNWWQGGKEIVECANCGDEKKVSPYRLEDNNNFFCDVTCRGEWATKEFSGENHPLYEGNKQNYGAGWLEKRAEARERDDGMCQNCGITQKELDKWPDVHHIIPVDAFLSKTDAHFIENLISLCTSCHTRAEAGTIDCPKPEGHITAIKKLDESVLVDDYKLPKY